MPNPEAHFPSAIPPRAPQSSALLQIPLISEDVVHSSLPNLTIEKIENAPKIEVLKVNSAQVHIMIFMRMYLRLFERLG